MTTQADARMLTLGAGLTSGGGSLANAFRQTVDTPLTTRTAANSANLTFALDNNYDAFKFDIRNLLPATDSVRVEMYVSTDGGATYLASGYDYLVFTTANENKVFNTTKIQLNQALLSNAAASTCNGWVTLDNPFSSAAQKQGLSHTNVYQASAANHIPDAGGIAIRTTSPITHVRFQFTSGKIVSGTVHMVGRKFV